MAFLAVCVSDECDCTFMPSHTVAAEAQLNEEFEMQKTAEYVDPENWTHHIPYILPQVSLKCFRLISIPLSLPFVHTQGRTVWWNPLQKAEDELVEDEEDEDEEKEQPEEPEPETGPPLLSAISADES